MANSRSPYNLINLEREAVNLRNEVAFRNERIAILEKELKSAENFCLLLVCALVACAIPLTHFLFKA
jgi:hypothetical protein